jgi:hypothetical protein
MTTLTTRYGLTKLATDGSDLINVVIDFNNNWDSLDLKLGTQVCTSTTRPSSPVQGVLIFETDTGFTRKYKGAAWEQVGIATCTSGARPSSNLIAGDLIFETNTGFTRTWTGSAWQTQSTVSAASGSMPSNPITGDLVYVNNHPAIAMWNGSAWIYETIVICTSSTRPVSFIINGTQIYETDTGRFLTYNGTTWVNTAFSNFVCTSSTHPSSPFQGLEIFETDTLQSAIFSGSNFLYAVQQLAPTQVLGGTTASVTFSGIPAGVTHLTLVWHARGDQAAGTVNLQVQINGVTTANQITERAEASTATVSGANATGAASLQIGAIPGSTATALYFGAGSMECPGWGDTTNYTPVVGVGTSFPGGAAGFAGVYGGISPTAGTNTSLKVFPASGNFVAGTRFSIYGRM